MYVVGENDEEEKEERKQGYISTQYEYGICMRECREESMTGGT